MSRAQQLAFTFGGDPSSASKATCTARVFDLAEDRLGEELALFEVSFYLVAAAFDASGTLGLLDERRGRRGLLRLTPEIVAFLQSAEGSGAALADEVETRFGVRLHRRTVERVRS